MSRLRIRIELSRGGVGVPLHKLASVISESQRFLALLAEDVGIENGKGEWLGFDFDPASLDFTAEYIGPVSAGQVRAFNAAFEGTTSLRRATIAQFARITESIREDEVVGFGLFTSDEADQPSEWHCLSRRDALRIAGEIQVLLDAAGETGQPSHLPAARDPNLESRAFVHRRERGADTAGVVEYVRNVEANLTGRIHRLEDRVEQHSGVIRNLEGQWGSTEASLRNLVSNIETFCEQASRQIERVAPAALPAASGRRSLLRWWPVAAAAGALVIAAALFGTWSWGWRPAHGPESVQASAPAAPPAVTPAPPATAPAAPAIMRIDLEALDRVWVSLLDAEGNQLIYRTLEAGDTRSVELATAATLRTGNAGALRVLLDGKPIGPIGPPGRVREIFFADGTYSFADSGGR